MKRLLLVLVLAVACRDGDSDVSPIGTKSGPFGEFLVDASGRPLYAFSGDAPGQTACLTNCATVWPPVLVDTAPRAASAAVDGSKLEVFTRPDGARQLSYAGQPLYHSGSNFSEADGYGHHAMSFGGRFMLVSPAGQPLPPPR